MTNNPYVFQIMQQTGMTESEVKRSVSRPTITDADAQAKGFATAEEYREALHEFLNGM